MTRLGALIICLLGVLVLAGPRASTAQEAFTDAKLHSFASAVVAVNAIVERWRPQIQAAPSDADKQRMAEQANEEMRAAVEGTEGLSVEEYQAIAQAAQGDPQLMARIDKVFKEMVPAPQ
jgi:outer membrane murein-binding lipoprotein Lpp